MEKIIQSLINNWVRGVDTYTHNGSTWLIFTDSKKWVVELTKEKTLWYNYNFFKQIFEFTSLDVVENQQYITKWVEDNIVNKVTEIKIDEFNTSQFLCEDVIENGVKKTISLENCGGDVNYIINNGVTETDYKSLLKRGEVDDTIKNGVKNTLSFEKVADYRIEDAIENGVKEIKICNFIDPETQLVWVKWGNQIDDVIKNGIKETNSWNESIIGDLNQNGCIDAVIKEGVKEIKTPGKEGDYRDYMEWMENRDTYSVVQMVDDIIDGGIKETKHANKYNSIGPVIKEGKINDIIDNGVKVSGTFVGGNRQKENIESVIGYGTKNNI